MRLINNKGTKSVKSYDFVIMSNVDLFLNETFFTNLLCAGININEVGWDGPKLLRFVFLLFFLVKNCFLGS